jgi:DNA-binding transcriptional regulator YiaG
MDMATAQFEPEHVLPLRTALGMTQTELADAVGVSQPTVALWEAGQRRPSGAATILLKQLQRKKSAKKSGKRA